MRLRSAPRGSPLPLAGRGWGWGSKGSTIAFITPSMFSLFARFACDLFVRAVHSAIDLRALALEKHV
jgi:hypothetical protein